MSALRRPLSPPLVLGAVGVLFVASVTVGASGMVRVWETQRELEALERDIAHLRVETQKLAQTAECLRNDPLCIEKLAREELGWVREDETVLKFPSPPK